SLGGQGGAPRGSGLAADAGPDGYGHIVHALFGRAVGSPAVGGDDARVDQLEPLEEPGDLGAGAGLRGDAALVVEVLDPAPGRRVEVGGPVTEDQVAAGGQRRHERSYDAHRIALRLVLHEVEQRVQRERDRLGEVQGVVQFRRVEDAARLPHVAVYVR